MLKLGSIALTLSALAAVAGCAGQNAIEPARATTFATVRPAVEPAYSNDDLTRNFIAIALRAEAADDVDWAGEIALTKWVNPVRIAVFGADAIDLAEVERTIGRVRSLTGLDIARAGPRDYPSMTIDFVQPWERPGAVASLGGAGVLGPNVRRIAQRWRDGEFEKCLGLIAVRPEDGAIGSARILIKSELPRSLRTACIVEEISQSLGLMNDYRRARPSIFNDDQEFLALTSHDALLLRALYDPSIRPGMRRSDVEPLLDGIFDQIRPEDG